MRTLRVVLIAALLLAAQIATAQTPGAGAAHAKPFRIAGVVIDSVNGDPVARATVVAASPLDFHTIAAVQADESGRFALEQLPAGKYALIASKTGYRTAMFAEHRSLSSAIVTGEAQSTEDLRFLITPSSSLEVHVIDDFGEPVGGAGVTIAQWIHGDGSGGALVPTTFTPINPDGETVIYMLQPGDYYIAVSAHPWYAMNDAGVEYDPGTSSPANLLDVAYPITYFDGTTSESLATPVHLLPGRRESITVALHAVPAQRIQLPPADRAPGGMEDEPRPLSLRASFFGSDFELANAPHVQFDQDGGRFLSGIAPGSYELIEGAARHRFELGPSGSPDLGENTGSGAANIKVSVQPLPHEHLPQDLKLEVRWADKTHPMLFHRVDIEDGKASITGLQSGEWELELLGRWASIPILSTTANGLSARSNHFRVGDKPIELTITVRASALRVEGLALKEGHGRPGVLMLLVPEDMRDHSDWLRVDQTDSDGSFGFSAALPGKYTLIALEDAWDLPWKSPEFLERYLPGGTVLTIPEQLSGTYRLPVTARIQPAAASADTSQSQ